MSARPAAPSFTLYSQPGCMPCRAVVREMDQAGVDYTVVDIQAEQTGYDLLVDLGLTGTPVVVTSDGDYWHGHYSGSIKALAKAAA